MSVLPVGFGSSLGGYQIERSLRFNSADSAYLNRTLSTSGSLTTWTWSAWVKRSELGSLQVLFSAGTNGVTYHDIYINSDDTLRFVANVSGTPLKYTTQVFRDTSAWYHIVGVWDTPNATADDRMRLYVNGVRITAFGTSTNPTSSQGGLINSSSYPHAIGRRVFSSSNYFSGYLTEINFIDGQALTPSSFGLNDPETGVWSPKRYTGTYGTNGFYLKFADNSGTTSTTLGKDSSGNGNNWTPNNFSVTAGAGNDSLVDSPTSYGTDTGVGGEVRGNYCTWNPITGLGGTFSDGNLKSATGTSSQPTVGTIQLPTTGKWYWEVTVDTVAEMSVGINKYPFSSATRTTYYRAGGSSNSIYIEGTVNSYNASSYTNNDVIAVGYDADNSQIRWYKNNVQQGGPYTLTSLENLFPYLIQTSGSGSCTGIVNFGQRPFAYTAPSGFKALCTTNLPTPTIGATSTTQADEYFDVLTYTGQDTNLNTNTIRALSFQPGMVWEKSRVSGYHHFITDEVRTAAKVLSSSQTAAESSWSDNAFYVSINSDGVTLKGNTAVCDAGDTHVLWTWKANGAGSSNTAGSITSTVSASTTSGFSIATFTQLSGSPYVGTVGHGLGVAPSMVIIKDRSIANGWLVYHSALGATKYLVLSSTAAAATGSNAFNNTAPTSTVFTTAAGSTYWGNAGATAVAYCFAPVAGYSAFGSYTGNGSTDGPFVYLGFRPRYVLIKPTASTGGSADWLLIDSARYTYNVSSAISPAVNLVANSSAAEDTNLWIQLMSNGFKCASTQLNANANGVNYIYAAFAETPAKFSLAR